LRLKPWCVANRSRSLGKTLELAARWIIRADYAVYTPTDDIGRLLPLVGAHRVNQVSLTSMTGLDECNILTVLYNTQETKCSDPRDRLFAILGVVEDTVDVNINYSIPVQTVYRNWAINRVRRTRFEGPERLTFSVLALILVDRVTCHPGFQISVGHGTKISPLCLLTTAQEEARKGQMM
jgi:hypothetical protein